MRAALLPLCLCALSALHVAAETQTPESGADQAVVVVVTEDGVQRVAVTLDSYSYDPAHIIIRVGIPVELVLTSATFLTPHNFILKEPEAGLEVDEGVGAGEGVTVRFTPSRLGVYTFYCDKKLLFFPSHREKGMEGILEVRE